MIWQIWAIAWILTGSLSFIITQNLIKGWSYVASQGNFTKTMISAMIMGPFTSATCIYILHKYYTTRKQ
jgi:hypothetical protein